MEGSVDPVVAVTAIVAACLALLLLGAWYLCEPDE
jgi:hypothetical protein